jgi:predicted nucleic acid-binding protein
MRALLDSNVVLRHLTGAPREQARRATAFLASAHELILTDVVMAEIVYVLESFYRRPRAEIAETAASLLALPSIETADPMVLLRALELYGSLRRDFGEMDLAATAERLGLEHVVSFDRDLDAVPSLTRFEP